jgi:hypothetical protein
MRKEEVARGDAGRIVLVDSITQVTLADQGSVVVSGSHGGTSSAAFALEVPLALVAFNDAGVGKDAAGIAALALLQVRGVAAVTVAHTSARIGDAGDAWTNGVVSHANDAALEAGVVPGVRLREALARLIGFVDQAPDMPTSPPCSP